MPYLRNDKEVSQYLFKVLIEVIKRMEDRIRDELVDYIKTSTYQNDYFPNYVYENGDGSFGSGQPSFEFEQAWRWKGMIVTRKQISDELFYAWKNMTIDRVTGRHWNGKDTRSILADMMNVSGVVGNKDREPFWDLFIAKIDREIDTMWRAELIREGLNIL